MGLEGGCAGWKLVLEAEFYPLTPLVYNETTTRADFLTINPPDRRRGSLSSAALLINE